MNAECPSCGHQFIVKRRPDGTGSAPQTPEPTDREIKLLYLLKTWETPLTVREIQARIFDADNKTVLTGGYSWNYHLIQATVSTLVGRGLVTMRKKGQAWEYWAPKVLA